MGWVLLHGLEPWVLVTELCPFFLVFASVFPSFLFLSLRFGYVLTKHIAVSLLHSYLPAAAAAAAAAGA